MNESDGLDVADQYRTPDNLQARIDLHARFSTNHYGWQRWVFDHIQLDESARVLELGCGPAGLWRDNLDRVPLDWQMILSDASQGMVDHARKRLAGSGHSWCFLRCDAGDLPLLSSSVDTVVANHMLYHVQDLDGALAETRRVLRPGGHLFASTVGAGHLCELRESLERFAASSGNWGGGPYVSFNLENGQGILERQFAQVTLDEYEDGLCVTDAVALADYALSSHRLPAIERTKLIGWFEAELAGCGGAMHIGKRSGMFRAVRQ